MKLNKEIKNGDKIWMYTPCLNESSYYTVISVKKVKTLVEVVVKAKLFDKEYEITMYGHASSSLLSGFIRKFPCREMGYTCDYELIRKKTENYERDRKYINAGTALLQVAKYLK